MSDEKKAEVYVCRFDGSDNDRKAGFVAFDAEGAAEEFVDCWFQNQQIETSKPYRVSVTSKDGVTTLWEVTMNPSLDVVAVSIP